MSATCFICGCSIDGEMAEVGKHGSRAHVRCIEWAEFELERRRKARRWDR